MDVTTEATCRSVVKMDRSAEKYYTLSNSSLAPTVPASIYIAAKWWGGGGGGEVGDFDRGRGGDLEVNRFGHRSPGMSIRFYQRWGGAGVIPVQ